jgi:acyl-CoA synthetase (NDP forming)
LDFGPDGKAAIRSFLAPKSVAVIGASADERTMSGRPLVLLRQHDYRGALYPVNPNRDEIGGLPCYPNVRDIPGEVDLALVCVPADRVPAAVQDCRDAGVRGVYVISSGFDEAPGDSPGYEVSERLRQVIDGGATRMTGPNAEGIYNLIDDVAIGFSPVTDYTSALKSRPRPGNVAVVAHSGGLGFGILNQGLARGIDFSYVISTGNELDLGMLEYVDYLIDDEHTTVIVLFLEGLARPLELRDLGLRAAAAGKAIVAAKVGRSVEAQRAAVSHTGHVTGPSHLWSALFRQAGIIEVTDIAELLDVVAVCSRWGAASGRRVGVVTASGGAGAWMTDALRSAELEVPELGATVQDGLAGFLPYYAGTRNPVDMTAVAGQPGVQSRVLSLVGGSENVDAMVAVTSLIHAKVARANAALYAQAARESGKPLVAYSYTALAEGVADAFAEQGIPVLVSQSGVARGIAALVELGSRKAPDEVAVLPGGAAPGEAGHGEAGHGEAVPGDAVPLPGEAGDRVLHEAQVKAWLASSGFSVPPGRLVRSARDAVEAAEQIGYPVVAKGQAAGLPHKGDHGVVALNLGSADEVRDAYQQVYQRAADAVGDDEVAGVLIEQMVPAGFEMLAGVTRDPLMGPFLTVGAGGRLAEVFHDVAVLPVPATAGEVASAIATLRCGAALAAGSAGSARPDPLDLDAFCDLAARISAVAASTPELLELDLNPVIVHSLGQGADIADALAVRAPAEGTPS